MKKGECKKCEKENYLEEHHIYPKSKFDDDENTIYLCPNCHTDYHQKLGKQESKDKNFYFSFYMSWLFGLIVVIILIGLISIFY
jgi:predicted restriction endonuclease